MEAIIIDCNVVSEFESRINGSIQINHESLIAMCPISEGQCYKVVLHYTDINRVFLLYAPNLTNLTINRNYQLNETIEEAGNEPRVQYWLDRNIDLSTSDSWAPVFVSPNLDTGSLVAIDGNHRLMAHFLTHKSIQGLQAYLFVHPNITNWKWFPPHAK